MWCRARPKGSPRMPLSVIVPTYNEQDNIRPRTERLFTQQQPPPSWEAQVPATSSSPTDGAAGTVLFFGVGGFLTRERPLMGRSFDVKLAGEDQLAVIVWRVHWTY